MTIRFIGREITGRLGDRRYEAAGAAAGGVGGVALGAKVGASIGIASGGWGIPATVPLGVITEVAFCFTGKHLGAYLDRRHEESGND